MLNISTQDAGGRMLWTTTAPPRWAVALRRASGDKGRGVLPCPRGAGCLAHLLQTAVELLFRLSRHGFHSPPVQLVSKKATGKHTDMPGKLTWWWEVMVPRWKWIIPLLSARKSRTHCEYGLFELLVWIYNRKDSQQNFQPYSAPHSPSLANFKRLNCWNTPTQDLSH